MLCIDDEPAGLQFRKMVLEREGYSVVTATTATQALEFFKAAHFDAVITDHLLGRLTATAMIAEMKRLNPWGPIIVLSGVAEIPEHLGQVDAFVSKADGPAALLAKVDELIQGARKKRLAIVSEAAEQVATEEAAHVQRLLAAIVESSDDAIFSKTLEGIITSWNDAAEMMYGYRAEEIIGQPVAALLPPDRPERDSVNSSAVAARGKNSPFRNRSRCQSRPFSDGIVDYLSYSQFVGPSCRCFDHCPQYHADKNGRAGPPKLREIGGCRPDGGYRCA